MLKIIVTRMEILPGKATHLVLERCCAVCELGSSGATCLLETKLQLSSQRQNLLCVVFNVVHINAYNIFRKKCSYWGLKIWMFFKQTLCKVVRNSRYWLNCQVTLFPVRREAHIDCSCKELHMFLAHLPTNSLLQKIQDTVFPTDICASQSHTHFFL